MAEAAAMTGPRCRNIASGLTTASLGGLLEALSDPLPFVSAELDA